MPGPIIANTAGSYGTPIFGEPGEVWTNNTSEYYYQFHCAWHNTCGQCAQYDGAVRRGSWGIPLHRNCRCTMTPILPSHSAPSPFTDFRAAIDVLDPAQQRECIGASNYKLLKEGLVNWEDIVTRYRVRTLQEVVALKKLTVAQMEGAGVRSKIAAHAFASVHTPAHELAAQARAVLVANLEGAGMNAAQIARIAAQGLAARVSIASGPGGPSGPVGQPPGGGPWKPDLDLLRSFLAMSAIAQRADAARRARNRAEATRRAEEEKAARAAAEAEAARLAAQEVERARIVAQEEEAQSPKLLDITAPASEHRPKPGKENLPVTQFIPNGHVVPKVDRDEINAIAAKAPSGAISPVPVGLLRVQSDKLGVLQDQINKRISEFYRDNPSTVPIVAIFQEGTFFVHEGHHRAVGAVMRGDFSIPGLIFREKPGGKHEAELVTMDSDGNLHPYKK